MASTKEYKSPYPRPLAKSLDFIGYYLCEQEIGGFPCTCSFLMKSPHAPGRCNYLFKKTRYYVKLQYGVDINDD